MDLSNATFNNWGNGQQVIAENYYGSEKVEKQEVELSRLQECAEKVRAFFWGESSMAVIFCVCRDFYGYVNNMSRFEREFHCSEGLLSNTFRNNPYMQLPVEKWQRQGAKERVLRLVEAYRKAVEQEAAEAIPTE